MSPCTFLYRSTFYQLLLAEPINTPILYYNGLYLPDSNRAVSTRWVHAWGQSIHKRVTLAPLVSLLTFSPNSLII